MAKVFKLGEPARPKPGREPVAAAINPVARVVLDTPVSHLAREFDYLVPETMGDAAQPGVRVKVKFGSQDLAGFVTARLAESEQQLSDLKPLKKVVSPEPVLKPEILALAGAVADYYGGTVPDVLRFAVPPRHARAETAPQFTPVGEPGTPNEVPLNHPWLANWLNTWQQYQNADQLIASLCNSKTNPILRYVWTPLPGLAAAKPPETIPSIPLWAAQIAALTAVVKQGILIVAPDINDVNRILDALELAGIPNVIRLVAEDGIEARYKNFLAIERGYAKVVVGTRSAVFAPIANLSLIILWGDGDESLTELHTPHFEAREVLAMRSDLTQVPLLVGSIGRTVAAQSWVEDGVAVSVAGYRDAIRARAPIVRIIDSAAAAVEGYLPRIPTMAAAAVRTTLASGSVLVQVPLTGYLPRFECQNCRTPARCQQCGGPLALPDAGGVPSCRTCGQIAPTWRCATCGSTRIRAGQIGADRTAEELGRAFPGTQIIISTGTAPGGVKPAVPRPRKPAIVIATPGAEPVMPGGYAAALILDAGAQPARLTLDFATGAVRRWLTAAHLVVPGSAGGQVLLVGDADPAATAALVRFDPVFLAERELAERLEAGMPPAVRFAELTGDAAAVEAALARVELATPAALLGPVPIVPQIPTTSAAPEPEPLFTEPQVRVLIRVPAAQSLELASQLRAAQAVRSAKREPGQLRITLDPPDFG